MIIRKPAFFSFRNTVLSHGWFQLAPFSFDEENCTLDYLIESEGGVTEVSIRETPGSLRIGFDPPGIEHKKSVLRSVRRILRLDEPFAELYSLVEDSEVHCWIKDENHGPMLRSPTVFEDLVKTICTTNCSWGLTKAMTANLVESLGNSAPSRKKAFPTPAAMAAQSESFFKDEIRAGYRGPYLLELAESVASGELDPERWLDSDLPTVELKKKIKGVKGVGDYAAEHLLKLVGRYDGLALDSFLRSSFYKYYNGGKACPDKKIERQYRSFGSWRGLVIWFDMIQKRSVGSE